MPTHHAPDKDQRHGAVDQAADDCTDEMERACPAYRVRPLVIHGADDPLVSVERGKDTAAAMPDARLMATPEWGMTFGSNGSTKWPMRSLGWRARRLAGRSIA